MKENCRLFGSFLILLCFVPFAIGQNGSSNNYSKERPTTRAHPLSVEPIIDGLVQNDQIWDAIDPFSGFWQVQPMVGKPASEKTEIRIAFSTQKLFISVICFDKHPESLVVSDARRDASLDNTDAFLFILDTYKDGQNGFVFGTNPLGVEYDAQVDNEGQGNFNANRQQGGMIGGFNLNWDAAWLVKTYVGDFGWSAEFAIPLRTLRYAPGDNQTWGINFRRNIRKSNEIAYWSPIPIEFNLNRLSLAGNLTGLNLKNPGNLKIIPYALGNLSKNHRDLNPSTKLTTEFGADLKYSIASSMTLDLTYNTDFAQVEVDEQQINLDRFNLFFPEKRPFFLENAGLFSVGSPGEVDLFFSRRIGLGGVGEIVPIIGGGRLSGKIKKTNIGFLSMFTDDIGASDIRKNNYTVARVNHEFAPRSAIGAAFINREGLSEHSQDFNRVFAADGKIGLGQKAQISGFYARSRTPGVEDAENSFNMSAAYTWAGWEISLGYTEVGEGFNPEVGFLLRDAFRKPSGLILYHWRMNGKWGLLELRPHISYRSYWNFDGSIQTSFLHIDNHWEWESGFEVHTGVNVTTEGVSAPFEISEGVIVPIGKYQHQEAQLVFLTNQSKSLSISTRHILGGFLGGKRYANSATLYFRLGDKFNSEFSLIRNDIELPYGDFTTNIFRSRVSYSFTPRIYVQSLLQYNNVRELWSANIRFGWLQDANTGLFLVYNELHDTLGIGNRGLTVKYSRVFDIIH